MSPKVLNHAAGRAAGAQPVPLKPVEQKQSSRPLPTTEHDVEVLPYLPLPWQHSWSHASPAHPSSQAHLPEREAPARHFPWPEQPMGVVSLRVLGPTPHALEQSRAPKPGSHAHHAVVWFGWRGP